MSLENNERLAKRWFLEMWSKPDPAVADQIISADYAPEWVQIEAKGPEQVKHEIRYFRSVFPDLRYEIKDLSVLVDRVWVQIFCPRHPAWEGLGLRCHKPIRGL